MPFAAWMIALAAVLPYLTVTPAKMGVRDFDNRNPRKWMAAQQGWRRRAASAEQNLFECFPIFAAAVLLALLQHAPQRPLDWLAGGFVALRILYALAYMADRASLRSAIWALSFLCILAIFALAGGLFG